MGDPLELWTLKKSKGVKTLTEITWVHRHVYPENAVETMMTRTMAGGRRNRDRYRSGSRSRSRSQSPKQKKPRRREKERQSSPSAKEDYAESLSIEETNKLRAKLGLAPLEIDDAPKTKETDDGTTIHVEDGFEFRHKRPENWSDKKREAEMKEKLEIAKKKRHIYERVLTAKA
ncbi:hypothetical protein KIN20_010020 [Parelaphostrongylus tenuis]|uniref:Uncharacterized protein n=1 Tax=Parelaphostrongylus tenuis TaxID=148309 RepID=A0AAD5MSP8_PARTN|nr:hypothetical protein KIN20_010020 [Parelaphostrongylus tenuis]